MSNKSVLILILLSLFSSPSFSAPVGVKCPISVTCRTTDVGSCSIKDDPQYPAVFQTVSESHGVIVPFYTYSFFMSIGQYKQESYLNREMNSCFYRGPDEDSWLKLDFSGQGPINVFVSQSEKWVEFDHSTKDFYYCLANNRAYCFFMVEK